MGFAGICCRPMPSPQDRELTITIWNNAFLESLGMKTILLIDDSEEMRITFCAALCTSGFPSLTPAAVSEMLTHVYQSALRLLASVRI
jgi:hypothetical protein